MFDFKKWYKTLIIIPAVLISSGYTLISDMRNSSVNEMFIWQIFGRISLDDKKAFVIIVDSLIYFILFNILYGNFIYEDFRYSSVYLFTRLKNRKKWLYKKSLELFSISVVYTILFLTTTLAVCMICTKQFFIDSYTIRLFLFMFIIIISIIFVSTLIINVISIRFGNTIGFICVYTCILVLVFAVMRSKNINNEYLRILNPMYGVILNLFDKPAVQAGIIAYYVLLIVLSCIISAKYIEKLDIALTNCEFK